MAEDNKSIVEKLQAELRILAALPSRSRFRRLALWILGVALLGAGVFGKAFVEKKAEQAAAHVEAKNQQGTPPSVHTSSRTARGAGGGGLPGSTSTRPEAPVTPTEFAAAAGVLPPSGAEAGSRAARSPLTVQVAAHVEGSITSVLKSGMQLRSGDVVTIRVTTSAAANAYLLFCDSGGRLSLYPQDRAIVTKALVPVSLPADGEQFVLDDNPGSETFYVVAARGQLSKTDPRLNALIENERVAGAGLECNAQMTEVLAGPTPGRQPMKGGADVQRGFAIVSSKKGSDDALINIASGDDGIAIVKYAIEHRR